LIYIVENYTRDAEKEEAVGEANVKTNTEEETQNENENKVPDAMVCLF